MIELTCMQGWTFKKTCGLLAITTVPILVLQVWVFKDFSGINRAYKNFFLKDGNRSGVTLRGVLNRSVINPQDKSVHLPCVLNITNLNTHVSPADRRRLIENSSTSIFSHVTKGGSFVPPWCKAIGNVAVIVPYRQRKENLQLFLPHMHSFLQKQMINYTIFVVEMTEGALFNRGILMNVGFHMATKLRNFTCFVFHDVDLLPTNERNLYNCHVNQIRLMGTGNSKNKYRVPYPTYFGGVVSFTEAKFRVVNGFSNLYFGWGNEDDDLMKRLQVSKNKLIKLDPNVGRYEAMNHSLPVVLKKPNITRHQLHLSCGRRMKSEGLNSLIYKQLNFEFRDLYTWILIDVDRIELENRYLTCQMRGWPCDFKNIQIEKSLIPTNKTKG